MPRVGAAEELAQNALLAALEQWPRSGVPDNPAAWLMQTAKRRGRLAEARAEMEHAASLAQNGREKKLLLDRAATCVRA